MLANNVPYYLYIVQVQEQNKVLFSNMQDQSSKIRNKRQGK